jgi:filamentous hemagglutinin family protein
MNLNCRLIGEADPTTDRSEDVELRIAHIACLFVLPLYIPSAWAEPAPTELPGGGQVNAGQASIAVNGSHMDVNQTSQNAAINWQTFNIGSDAQVDFHQPDSSAVAVNRIADPNGSQIMGKLNANGQVYLINPNGILFGRGSQVNVGGLVASTLDTADGNTAADRRRTFASTGGTGKIVNQGAITAADGGYVALLGEQVSNQGLIQARLGTVALAAGDKIALEFAGNKLIDVEVDKGALQALAENKQLIQADGGMVLMTAKAADALLSTVVNNEGVIEARTVEDRNGVIKLLGDMDSGTVNVGGTLDASAPTTGDGGFIETSAAHVKIADDAVITTKAANGLTGSWLIDPVDFTIAAGSGALTTSGIGATTLSTSLGSSNVSIATDASTGGNGDIFVNSAVSWSANKLTLTAHRNIAINANLNGSGTASLALEYGQASVGGGGSSYSLSGGAKVSLPAGLNFSTKLGTGGATTPWTVITSLGVEGDATVAPGVMTLQGMNTGLAGNYVLGADIAASGTSTWNTNAGFVPVGNSGTNFTGNFDGLGHTVTGLTINRQVNVAVNFYQGLFGYATGALRNVGMLNSNIYGSSVAGTLAGYSGGTIQYAYADGGSVSASVHQAGGLVGQLGGSISNSYANVSVSGTDYACCGGGVASSNIGGLVGKTLDGSSISNSYSTGSVNGSTYVGGLVGQNRGDIDTSYASGAVTKDGGLSRAGGLIGDHLAGTISNSYWDSVTTGQGGTGGCSGGGCTGIVASLTDITAAPYAQASYTGLDFTNTWRIYEGNTRPLLKNFLTSLTVTANNATKTYNGLAYSGGNGVSYSTAPNANLLGAASYGGTSQGAVNAGSYAIAASGLYSNQRGYDITFVDGALTVNKANLTLSGTRIYDGTTAVAGSILTATGVNGETFAVGGAGDAANLASKNVQTGSALASLTGLSLGASGNGGLAANYNALDTVGSSITITAKALTVSGIAASNKVYDGTTAATVNTAGALLTGLVGGDAVTVNTTGAFADKNVANGKTVTLASSYDGADVGNYAITGQANTTANITAKALTVSGVTAGNKVYDGTTAATVNTVGALLTGLIGGDAVTVSATGTFADKNAANGKTVNLNSTYGGADVNNYAITGQANATADITAKALSVSALAASSKLYDGTTTALLTPANFLLSGFLGSDSATVTQTVGSYASPNAGSGIWVTASLAASDYAAGGTTHLGNYLLPTSLGGAIGVINPATLTYAATPASLFSGQTPSGLSGTVNGLVPGDTLTGSTTGALAWTTDAVASSRPGQYAINGGGLTLTNNNYSLVQAPANATALTLQPGTPPQPVLNTMALLESGILSPQASSQSKVPHLPTTMTVSQEADANTTDSGDASLSESGSDVAPNTKLNMMNIGGTASTLTFETPGVKLPDTMIGE